MCVCGGGLDGLVASNYSTIRDVEGSNGKYIKHGGLFGNHKSPSSVFFYLLVSTELFKHSHFPRQVISYQVLTSHNCSVLYASYNTHTRTHTRTHLFSGANWWTTEPSIRASPCETYHYTHYTLSDIVIEQYFAGGS